MSTNLAPIPDRHAIAQQGIGTLGVGSPVLGAGSGPKTSPIVRYLGALRRFKWLILLLLACGVGGGYFMSRLLPESFVVRGSFLVANSFDAANQPGQGGFVTTNDQWREFLESYRLLTPVVIGRQLFILGPERVGGPPLSLGPVGDDKAIFRGMTIADERSFRGGDYKLSFSADGSTWELIEAKMGAREQGKVGVDSIGRRAGFLWSPLVEPRWYGRTFAFRAITPREAADRLRKDLKIQTSPRSRYIYVELAGQDKEVITATVNDLMLEAEVQALQQKQAMATRNRISLDSITLAARETMYNDAAALAAYQTRTATTERKALLTTPGLAATTYQGVSEFNLKQARLRELDRSIADLDTTAVLLSRNALTADRFASIPDVANKAQLMARVRELTDMEAEYERQLSMDRTPDYVDSVTSLPRMRAQIGQLRDSQIPAAISAVRVRLMEQRKQEQDEITLARTQLEAVPGVTVTEQKLQNQVEVSTRIYNTHAANLAGAQTTEMMAAAELAIGDRALPPLEPTKNRRKVIVALGAMLGLAAGLGVAFLLDMFDSRVRYADQITAGLGLTILGVVPEVRRMKGDGSSVEEDAQVIEAFRTIRLNLAHAAPEGRLAITISSPAPSEGKSFISSNLALSFADAGYRTLLIDGDTRRGELHRNFGVDRRPGLIDHLADGHPLEPMLRPTSHPLCTLLTSGSRKRNAPELLGSARMREVIASQREHFDVIIVDSPPLGAGIDPFVLATLTGNLALVVRAGNTQKDLAEAKLQVVDQLPIRLVGAILNDVRASTNLYRYYSYNSGYAAFDEATPPGQLVATTGEKSDGTES